ncbi:MAG: ribonuclease HI family protein [Bacteroidota bacterium]|nr:ribonuclease HI family protein [Bacteroidota bacterium]
MKLLAFTDGASRNNPGEAGIGVLIKNERGEVLLKDKKYLGISTNNAAEYTALIHCLHAITTSESLRCASLVVHTDSELMARQVNGEYKVKDAGLKILYQQVKTLLASSKFSFSIKHIPRSQNKEADRLANEAIDSKT